jgi:hypothetical protein
MKYGQSWVQGAMKGVKNFCLKFFRFLFPNKIKVFLGLSCRKMVKKLHKKSQEKSKSGSPPRLHYEKFLTWITFHKSFWFWFVVFLNTPSRKTHEALRATQKTPQIKNKKYLPTSYLLFLRSLPDHTPL